MEHTAAPLHMTLTDVAALARVQRPVVSMWRRRSASSPDPFPAPAGSDRGLELFDGVEVVEWLAATGRGNNPDAAADLAAFARPERIRGVRSQAEQPNFDALTSLLALKALMGSPLGVLDIDDLLDAADEHDPDDLFLYSELEVLGPDLLSMAGFADRLADSAYNEAEAFEGLLANRFRSGLREHADTALTDEALALVSSVVAELAVGLDTDPVFVEATSGGSDVLLGVVKVFSDRAPFTVLAADDGGPAARLVRRRLRVHGVESAAVRTDGDPATGALVHVAQYPPPGKGSMDNEAILSAVARISTGMDDGQRAVIIAPAAMLCDALSMTKASELRSSLLRTGRVRAIVRLPQGLVRSKPREAQALWVLGPSYADVGITDRWTMVADLTRQRLSEAVSRDLISDVVASMGDLLTVRAHSFRFARLIRTRTLLAARGALVTARDATAGSTTRRAADDAVRVEHLLRLLGANSADGFPLLTDVVLPAHEHHGLAKATVDQLIVAGNIRYVQGNRLEADDQAQAAEGARLLGPAELLARDTPLRRIPLLEFTARFPSGRLTQPGDVVFCTSPKPAAIVDAAGGSVVVFTARVLRIDAGDPSGLLAEVVAADINALPETDKNWRHWYLRRTPDRQRRHLKIALERLQHEQDTIRERLGQVEELASLILDGVAGGSLTLTDPISPVPPTPVAPTEGTT